MIRICYQGNVGSNSEAAAERFTKEWQYKNNEYELVPFISSARVVDALLPDTIDFGVVAVMNTIAGVVQEPRSALENRDFELVDTLFLSIHHCLFIKPNVSLTAVNTATSHILALNQTRETRQRKFPALIEIETYNAAAAAKELSENDLPDNYAVICRKNAGEMYGLKLVAENIEDNKNNITEFWIVKSPSPM